jgi:hypothetical protein
LIASKKRVDCAGFRSCSSASERWPAPNRRNIAQPAEKPSRQKSPAGRNAQHGRALEAETVAEDRRTDLDHGAATTFMID